MQLLLKIVLPLLIFIGAVFVAKTIRENAPEPQRRPSFAQIQAVDAVTLEPTTYAVNIQSRGTIRPARENALVPEIAGTITGLSTQFVVGGRFESGERVSFPTFGKTAPGSCSPSITGFGQGAS